MLGLAPDVFVMNYLSATKQLSSDIEEKAINFMEKGTKYTNLLTPKLIK
jgi:pyoverdine/dityrosine biosynthesis protein Dit1